MNEQTIVIALVLIILVIVYVFILSNIIRNSKLYKQGLLGSHLVSKVLNRFTRLRNYKVYKDITLAHGKSSIHLDHILIGFFGIIVVDSVQNNGDYFGDDKDSNWVYIDTETSKKTYMPNPIKDVNNKVEILRKILGSKDIYNIDIDSFVVFTGTDKKMGLYAKESIGAVKLGQFKSILKHSKYATDKDIDVSILSESLESFFVK